MIIKIFSEHRAEQAMNLFGEARHGSLRQDNERPAEKCKSTKRMSLREAWAMGLPRLGQRLPKAWERMRHQLDPGGARRALDPTGPCSQTIMLDCKNPIKEDLKKTNPQGFTSRVLFIIRKISPFSIKTLPTSAFTK